MTHDRLTCVVPTHNRPHFLRRLLHFYSQFPPGFPFLIVDSSNLVAAAENREVVQGVHGKLDIDYQHFDLNIMDKCVQGLARVRSPFVVFCADDDYLFSNAVWRCADFLMNQPAFASVMGRTAMLNVNHSHGRCRILKGYSIDDSQPFDRCRQMAAQWFSNAYAVYRTEDLHDIFRITAANTNSGLTYHLPEVLASQLSVLRGRVKVLPLMYSLRERHDANVGGGMRSGVRPQAEQSYQQFRECLIDQFSQAGIDHTDAGLFIDRTFGFYRDPNLAVRFRRRTAIESIRHFFGGISERAVDYFSTDRTRHRRSIRASDLVGCEPIWNAAVQLIKDFPKGIPSEHSML